MPTTSHLVVYLFFLQLSMVKPFGNFGEVRVRVSLLRSKRVMTALYELPTLGLGILRVRMRGAELLGGGVMVGVGVGGIGDGVGVGGEV